MFLSLFFSLPSLLSKNKQIKSLKKTFRHLTFFKLSFTFLIKSKKQTKKYIDVLNRTSLCKDLTKQINIGPDKRNGAANSNIIYYEAFIYVCIYYI